MDCSTTAKVIVCVFVNVSIVVQSDPVAEFVAQTSNTIVPDDGPPIVDVDVMVTGYATCELRVGDTWNPFAELFVVEIERETALLNDGDETGSVKLNTAAEVVPEFVMVGADPEAPAATVPTAIVAAVPAAPEAPCEPVFPVAP